MVKIIFHDLLNDWKQCNWFDDSYDCFWFSKFQKTFIIATFNVVLNVQTRPHMLGP